MDNTKDVDERRLKARQLADQHRRKDRNAKLWTIGLVLAIVVAVAGIGAYLGIKERNTPVAAPSNVDGYSMPVSTNYEADGNKVPVMVYQDYNCPGCQQFHLSSTETLTKLSQDGLIDLKFHNVSILDNAAAGRDGSIRAANAAACVINENPDAFEEFNHLLYANQKPNHEGMSDMELTQYATEAGATDSSECINSGTYKGWALKAHQDGSAKITQTPTITVNGEKLEDSSNLEETLKEAHSELNS